MIFGQYREPVFLGGNKKTASEEGSAASEAVEGG